MPGLGVLLHPYLTTEDEELLDRTEGIPEKIKQKAKALRGIHGEKNINGNGD